MKKDAPEIPNFPNQTATKENKLKFFSWGNNQVTRRHREGTNEPSYVILDHWTNKIPLNK